MDCEKDVKHLRHTVAYRTTALRYLLQLAEYWRRLKNVDGEIKAIERILRHLGSLEKSVSEDVSVIRNCMEKRLNVLAKKEGV